MRMPFLFAVALGVLSATFSLRAADLFNPGPGKIESPRDDADPVVKRLTTNPEGQTPILKKLDSGWIKALADRGQPQLYTKANSANFAFIGMPIGGIGAGELYLSGDGRLWDWDIFGTRCRPGFPVEQGAAYQFPHKVGDVQDPSQQVLDQGFVLRTKQGGKTDTRTLDKDGFSTVTFSGQYPIGSVDYSDAGSPTRVHLEAFSPYIPGDVEDSSFPATILNYTVENVSSDSIECTLGGWMENAAGIEMRNEGAIALKNEAVRTPGYTALNFTMKQASADGLAAPQVFDDFETGKYDHWTVEGDAFGSRPVNNAEINTGNVPPGLQGQYVVDSGQKGNEGVGQLTSAPFVIRLPYLTFRIAGNASQQESISLMIDGKPVRTAAGMDDDILRPEYWDVKDLIGKTAQLQIVDQSPLGHVILYDIEFAHVPQIALEDEPDIGNMTLALMADAAQVAAHLHLDAGKSSDECLDAAPSDSTEKNVVGDKEKLIGALRRTVTLAPGEKKTFTFVVAWYFPNPLAMGLSTPTNRQYSIRFKSAQDVVDHLAANFDRLVSATREWHDTWYDSTLPYYFLDRTFLNTSTLATSTSYLLSDGRFYGYEGRYSCPGTCTHVWGYQQAMGYLFPDLEKELMEKVEFVPGLGMNDQGGIAMRAEYDRDPPVDGQSGMILRAYLAHRMSADNSFLQRNYGSIKKATDYLITNFDKHHNGILEGSQANTMDAGWFGKITWLSLYYQAALRATAEMADASHDAVYAQNLRAIADKGRTEIETQLFNGEYFIHQPDPAHPESPGTFNGCPIEQLMGQNWAYEVGMGDIVDRAKSLTALDSIWKYNYTTDVGRYREAYKPGRWYAMAGEGGLIMCTFPHGGAEALGKGNTFFSAYDNECWPGSEYEATALFMWDGKVDKALAEIKTLQERFDGAKRNPWNEVECGSHYSRSMASYGVFTAACGFEYDGPEGAMAFAPRIGPEDFKAAFTSAEGWGSFTQKYRGHGMDASITLCYGKLWLKILSLVLPAGSQPRHATVWLEGKEIPLSANQIGARLSLQFTSDILLSAGKELQITIE
jgi:non-lysosomal glucosylceramidase